MTRSHATPTPHKVTMATSLDEAFMQGFQLGHDIFDMLPVETEISGIPRIDDNSPPAPRQWNSQFQTIRNTVDRLTNFRTSTLQEPATKMLLKRNLATPVNVNALTLMVASMGAQITAITFKARRTVKSPWMLPVYRGFIAGTQTPERIFQQLAKLDDVDKMLGGRIITACVASPSDMVATGLAIAAFFKIADMFGVDSSGLTDLDDPSKDELVMLRFEGRFTLRSYMALSRRRTNRVEIIRSARNNVYILGPNGAGKSTWGNLLTGEHTFEVGTSDHTTMIPQSCDIENTHGFRLWDTPGLFDGSRQQALMQDYMDHMIDVNGYCAGVLFVFSGAVPANNVTAGVLKYAIERFGPHVQHSFVAVINDFWASSGDRMMTYAQMLHEHGYKVTDESIILSNGLDSPNGDTAAIHERLGSFEARLVARHREAYSKIIASHGRLADAVRNVYDHGRQELMALLKMGKIETVRYQDSGTRRNTSIPKDVIVFRQHSKGYIMRKLGVGKNVVKEERSVLLRGSAYFIMLVRAQLNQEYTIGESHIFVKHVLGEPRHILIHTPNSRYDYELRDATAMTDLELRAEVVHHLINQV